MSGIVPCASNDSRASACTVVHAEQPAYLRQAPRTSGTLTGRPLFPMHRSQAGHATLMVTASPSTQATTGARQSGVGACLGGCGLGQWPAAPPLGRGTAARPASTGRRDTRTAGWRGSGRCAAPGSSRSTPRTGGTWPAHEAAEGAGNTARLDAGLPTWMTVRLSWGALRLLCNEGLCTGPAWSGHICSELGHVEGRVCTWQTAHWGSLPLLEACSCWAGTRIAL